MLKSVKEALENIQSRILNLLFPESCPGCGTQDTDICKNCIQKIPFLNKPEPANWIFPLSSYNSKIVRQIVWRIKYKNRVSGAIALGRVLYDRMLEATTDDLNLKPSKWFIVPMPITKEHLKKRGYNQAFKISEGILINDLNGDYKILNDVLMRRNEIKSQVETKTRKERLKNPIGTFFIKNPEKIRGSKIVLIDDVVTTGATLREARKILMKAGAKKVVAVTLAYTERK